MCPGFGRRLAVVLERFVILSALQRRRWCARHRVSSLGALGALFVLPFIMSVAVEAVTSLAHEAAARVAVFRATDERSLTALPGVLGCVADLRDLFIQSIVFAVDPSQQTTVLLPSGRWETFKGWVVDHTRPIVSRRGQPCTREAGVDRTGTTVYFSSRTSWLDDPVARMAYDIVWMVKRFVGGAGGAVPGRLLSFRSGCVLPEQDVPVPDGSSLCTGDVCASNLSTAGVDDDVRCFSDVPLAVPSSPPDVRVWQLIMGIARDWRRLDATARTHAMPTESSSSEPLTPAPAELAKLYDTNGAHKARRKGRTAKNVAETAMAESWESGEVLGVLVDCHGDAGGVSVATLTPFEIVLALCRRRQLLAAATGARAPHMVSTGVEPSEVSLTNAQVAALAPQMRCAVHDVVTGWDALARSIGFADAEAMLSSYLLWSPELAAFVALARPGDAHLFAPVAQQQVLYHSRAADASGGAVGSCPSEAVGRSHLADAQLRAAAGMFLDHLEQCTALPSLAALRLLSRACVRGPSDAPGSSRRLPRAGHTLSVLDYRAPEWNRAAATIPSILSNAYLGFSAFARSVPLPLKHGHGAWRSDSDDDGDTTSTSSDESSSSGTSGAGSGSNRSGRTSDVDSSTTRRSRDVGTGDAMAVGSSDAGDAMDVGSSDDGEATSAALGERRDMARLVRRVRLRLAGVEVDAAVRRASGGLPCGTLPPAPPPSMEVGSGSGPSADTDRDVHLAAALEVIERAMGGVIQVHAAGFRELMATHRDAMIARGDDRSKSMGRAPAAAAPGAGDAGGPTVTTGGNAGCSFVLGGVLWVLSAKLAGTVQVVLTDPPYNTRRLAGQENAEHDVLTDQDVLDAVELFRILLRPGGHVLIFCSMQQHQHWVQALRASKDAAERGGFVPAFRVESAPIFMIKDPHAFHSVCRSSMHLGNRMEIVAHAYRAGLPTKLAYKMVNYCPFKSVPSRFHAFDNIIDNVRPPLYSEVVTDPAAGRSRKWMRREQKAVALLSELVQRYSQPNDIVVDPFAGTCAVAKACISLPLGQYRRVVVGDKDGAVLLATWARIVDAFVDQVVQGGYRGAVASDDVVQAARLLREAGQRDGSCSAAQAGTSARSRAQIGPAPAGPSAVRASSAGATGSAKENAWLAPKGLPAHSALPDSMLLFLASRWARLADEERRGRWGHPQVPPSGRTVASALLAQRGEPVDQWPAQLRCQLSVEDTMALRDQDAASNGLYVARSQLGGGTAGVGVFAARPFFRGDIVASFYGAIVYTSLGQQETKTARYAVAELGSHAPTAKDFRDRALAVRLRSSITLHPAGEADAAVTRPSGRSGLRSAGTIADGAGSSGMSTASSVSWSVAGGGHDPVSAQGGMTHRGTVVKQVYVVPAPYCVAGLVNDPRALSPIDTARERASGDGRALYNAQFILQNDDGIGSCTDLIDPGYVTVQACRTIAVDEEVLVDYGTEYSFTSGNRVRGGDRGVSRPQSTPHTFVGAQD